MPFMCTCSTRKGGCGKGRPLEIITVNSVKTVVFGNTDILHPCKHSVPRRSVAGSSSIYIRMYDAVDDGGM